MAMFGRLLQHRTVTWWLVLAVWSDVMLPVRTAGSIHASDEKQPLLVDVYPADDNTSAADPCFNVSYSSAICFSIEAALSVVLQMRGNDKPSRPATILLHPSNASDCSIAIFMHHSASTSLVMDASLSNLVIASHAGDSGCEYAVASQFSNPQSHGEPVVLFRLEGASRVALHGLKFSIGNRTTAIDVVNSTLVKVAGCFFDLHIPATSAPVINVTNSQLIVLLRCRLERINTGVPRIMGLWHSASEILSPIRVRNDALSQPAHDMTAMDERWLLGQNGTQGHTALRLALSRFQRYTINASRFSVRTPLKLGFSMINCTVRGAGVSAPVVSQIKFSLTYQKGSALQMELAQGASSYVAIIDNCRFISTRSPEGSAVMIRFFGTTRGRSRSCAHTPNMSSTARKASQHVLIHKCYFYNNVGMAGGGLSIKVDSNVILASVDVHRTIFRKNSAQQAGGAAIVRFAWYSQRENWVVFRHCKFLENRVGTAACSIRIYGSGIMAIADKNIPRIEPGPALFMESDVRFPLTIVNCVFRKNRGIGAFCSRSTRTGFLGSTTLSDSHGCGLVVLAASLWFEGNVTIENNFGLNGGGIHVSDFGHADFRKVTAFSLRNNSAHRTGAAMFFDTFSSAVPRDKLNIFIGRNHNPHFCPVVMPVNLTSTAVEVILKNNGNTGYNSSAGSARTSERRKRQNAVIYSSSWHKCFGMLNITRHGVEQQYVIESDYCPPYPPAHWSLSSYRTDNNSNCKKASALYLSLAPEGNRSFLRQPPKVCHSTCQNITVINDINLFSAVIKTAPAWLFFRSTTTSCYKEVADKVWFFRQNCSRDAIFEYASSINTGPSQLYDCSVFSLAMIRDRYRHSIAPTLPGVRFVLTPWSSLLHEWDDFSQAAMNGKMWHYQGHLFQQACRISRNHVINNSSDMASLTLYPAPGEQFDLDIDVADEFLTTVGGALRVSTQPDDNENFTGKHDRRHVLLGKDGQDYPPDKDIYYASHQKLKRLSISGVPGSTGYLKITYEGPQTAMRHVNSREFKLLLPFRLRQCHPGFRKPNITKIDDAIKYVELYSFTCRQEGQGEGKKKCNKTSASQLSCRCPNELDGNAVQKCPRGRDISLYQGYWGGMFPKQAHRNLSGVIVFDQRSFLYQDPVQRDKDLDGMNDSVFVVGRCSNGLCPYYNRSKVWRLSANPCLKESCRVGPLCGHCEEGFRVLIGSEYCHDCSKRASLSIYAYFPVLFILSAVVFAVLLVLNIGTSPTLNTWLFFIEVVFIIFAEDTRLRLIFFTAMSLGLGQMCITEHLTPLQAKAAILAHPLYMFLFMVLTWYATRTGVCARHLQLLQKRNSLAHVVWLCMIYCTATLAFIATSLLNNVTLHSWHKDYTVLFLDGSVQLFEAKHQPFAVIAILVLLVFVVPAPIVMAVPSLRSLPQFKWYTDEAMTLYEPECHWWAAVDLSRRLVLACLVGSINNIRLRQYLVSLACIFCLATHVAFRPFKRNIQVWRVTDVDNKVETLLLSLLCIMSVGKVGSSCIGWPTHLQRNFSVVIYPTLYICATVFALVFSLYRFVKDWRSNARSTPHFRKYIIDEDDEEMERQSALARMPRSRDGSSATSREDSLELSPLDRAAFRPVSNGLRDPLLIEHLLRSESPPYD